MPLLAHVTQTCAGWTEGVRELSPGAHVAVFADSPDAGVEGRLAGLELRDTLLVLRSGPTTSFVFLFRTPIAEVTLTDQIVANGVGALNVQGCRVGPSTSHDSGELPARRWPPNVLLVHGAACVGGTCEPNCATKLLDGQSGELTSGVGARKMATGQGHRGNAYGAESREVGTAMVSYGDSGGASRFFPQFAGEEELRAWIERLVSSPQ